MENLVINNQEMKVKEYNGERVVTFADIDRVHGRIKGTAKKNFTNNKKYLIDNEDYYILTSNDVGEKYSLTYEFNKYAPKGTLITESGYLMIVKSLTDDLAWKVQRELVKNYFRKKEENTTMIPINKVHHWNALLKMKEDLTKKNKEMNDLIYETEEKLFYIKKYSNSINSTLEGVDLAMKALSK